MENISFLQKKHQWKKTKYFEYNEFSNSKQNLETIKHFISNNKEYYYFILNDEIIVIKNAE